MDSWRIAEAVFTGRKAELMEEIKRDRLAARDDLTKSLREEITQVDQRIFEATSGLRGMIRSMERKLDGLEARMKMERKLS